MFEFRRESWWNKRCYLNLREKGITFCSFSYPGLPDAVIRSTPLIYYRLDGVPELYLSLYTTEKLKQVTDDILHFRGVEGICIYFNNDIEVSSIANAGETQVLIQRSKKALIAP